MSRMLQQEQDQEQEQEEGRIDWIFGTLLSCFMFPSFSDSHWKVLLVFVWVSLTSAVCLF